MKKTLLWIAGILVGLFLLVLGAVYLLFPEPEARAYAEKWSAENLGRTVTIGSIRPSLWGGLGVALGDVRVPGPASSPKDTLANIGTLVVKLRIWPLIKGRYEVARLEIAQARLYFVRYDSNASNFSFPALGRADSAKTHEPDVVAETKLIAAGFAFEDIAVSQTTILYRDIPGRKIFGVFDLEYAASLTPTDIGYQSVGDIACDSVVWESRIQGQKKSLRTVAPALSLTYDVGIDNNTATLQIRDCQAGVFGLQASVKGAVRGLTSPSALDVDLSFSLSEGDLGALYDEYLRFSEDGKNAAALSELAGSVSLAGSLQKTSGAELAYKVKIDVANLRAKGASWDKSASAEKLTVSSDGKSFSVASPRVSYGEADVAFDIGWSQVGEQKFHARIIGATDLVLFTPFLPTAGDPQLHGTLETDLTLSGLLVAPENTRARGNLRISNASLTANTLPENIENFECRLLFEPRKIVIESYSLKFPSSDISLDGSISDPFPGLLPINDSLKVGLPSPQLSFNLRSHRLDIDKLFPEAAPGSGVNRAELSPDSLPPLPVPIMNGSGRAFFDTLVYMKVNFTNVRSDIRIAEKKIYCENVTAVAFTGAVNGSTTVDLSDMATPRYTGAFKASDLEVDAFIKRFSPWGGAGALFGKVSLSGNYESVGWEPEEFLQGLNMDMDTRGANLEAKSVPLVGSLADALAQFSGKTEYKEKLRAVDLKDFSAKLQFADGRLLVRDFVGSSKAIGAWTLDGGVGIDGSLKLSGSYSPAEELIGAIVGNSAAAQGMVEFLRDPTTKKLTLPLAISGTATKPVAALDKTAMDRLLKNSLQKKGESFMQNLFGKPKK